MNFWLTCGFLTLISALIGFYPLWRGQKNSPRVQRDDLNKAFYFNRLKEIREDEAQGLLDNVAQSEKELQQNLLQDIPPSAENTLAVAQNFNKIWALSGLLLLIIVATLTYFSVGSWQKEQQLNTIYAQLPSYYQRLQEEDKNPLRPDELEDFVLALRIKLQKDPDSALDWWRLGELATRQGKGQLAMDSFARAYKLEPTNSAFKLSYAKFLLFSDNKMDKVLATKLIRSVLRDDHTNMSALSLLAFQYFSERDYRMAAATWAMMLQLLPSDDPRVGILQNSLMRAEAELEAQEQGQKQDAEKMQQTPKAQD